MATAFANEVPFTNINIPANGPVLTAVGLGVMIAIFITLGIVPQDPLLINSEVGYDFS